MKKYYLLDIEGKRHMFCSITFPDMVVKDFVIFGNSKILYVSDNVIREKVEFLDDIPSINKNYIYERDDKYHVIFNTTIENLEKIPGVELIKIDDENYYYQGNTFKKTDFDIVLKLPSKVQRKLVNEMNDTERVKFKKLKLKQKFVEV